MISYGPIVLRLSGYTATIIYMLEDRSLEDTAMGRAGARIRLLRQMP